MDFYNNKKNDILKFKLNAEGIDMSDIEARLVFKGKDNKSMLFIGAIKEGYCFFDVPELKLYEKDNEGEVKFEVIAGDVYFQPWKNTFNIKTQASFKVEEVIETVISKEREKPNISASVVEIIPKKEEKTLSQSTIVPKTIKPKKVYESAEEDEEIVITPELNPYADLKNIIKETETNVNEIYQIKEPDEEVQESVENTVEDEELSEIPDFNHFRMVKH